MLIRPDILLCLLIIVFVHSCIHYCLGIDLWQVPVKFSSCYVLNSSEYKIDYDL